MMSLKQIEFQLYEILLELRSLIDQEQGMESLTGSISANMERLQTLSYTLAVVGQFKRGKSSLINALLGMAVLPADATPTTATVNRITFGVTPEVTIKYKDGTKKILDDISELSDHVTKLSEEKYRVAVTVQEAVIAYPAVICQNHVDIIDTPGLGDDAEMTRTTIAVLEHIDAALFVISALSPYDEDEAKFVVSLLENREITNIVFAVNFMDQIDEDEYESAFCAIRSRVIRKTLSLAEKRFAGQQEQLDKVHRIIDDPHIFPVSAHQALKSFSTNDLKALEKSRIPVFKEKLYALVTREQCINSVRKAVDLLRCSIRKLDELKKEKNDQLDLELKELREKVAAIENCIRNFQQAVDEKMFAQYQKYVPFQIEKACGKVLPLFIEQMSQVTVSDDDAAIRSRLSEVTEKAQKEINSLIEEHKEYCRQSVLEVFGQCRELFPVIAETELEQKLLTKLTNISPGEYVLSAEQVLPPSDLCCTDVIKYIRRGLYNSFYRISGQLNQCFREQRAALFHASAEGISAFHLPSVDENEKKTEEKRQILLAQHDKMKQAMERLLVTAEALLAVILEP